MCITVPTTCRYMVLCFMILQIPFHQHTVEELIIGVEYPAKVCPCAWGKWFILCVCRCCYVYCLFVFLVASKRFTQSCFLAIVVIFRIPGASFNLLSCTDFIPVLRNKGSPITFPSIMWRFLSRHEMMKRLSFLTTSLSKNYLANVLT